MDQRKPLRIRDNLSRNQGFAQHGLRIESRICNAARRGSIVLFQRQSLIPPRGPTAPDQRALDRGRRNAKPLRFHGGPKPGSLLPRTVKDHIDQRPAALAVIGLQRFGCDINQIAIERALVPIGKNRTNLRGAHPKSIAQNAIAFGNHLHQSVFDPVMRGFDEMPRAVRAKPCRTGFAVMLRGDFLKHRSNPRPRARRPARHHRRTVPRALSAARHADAQKGPPLSLGAFHPSLGIPKRRITRINENIPRRKQRIEAVNQAVDHGSGRGEQDNRARRAHRCHQLGQIGGWNQLSGKILRRELARLFGVEIIERNTRALLGHVQREV